MKAEKIRMPVIDPLRYMVFLEGGVVALLATALARYGSDEPSTSQLQFWDGFAKLCELQLSSSGPRSVEIEKYRIDLLAVWDNWAIMLEAKMKREHVRRNQLQRYYKALQARLRDTEELAGVSSIAVIFLTPPDVGEEEYPSLLLDDNDTKKHLYWEEVLSLIDSSFSMSQPSRSEEIESFRYSLISLGAGQVRRMLKHERL